MVRWLPSCYMSHLQRTALPSHFWHGSFACFCLRNEPPQSGNFGLCWLRLSAHASTGPCPVVMLDVWHAGVPFQSTSGAAANQAVVEVPLRHRASGHTVTLLGVHLKAGACPANAAARAAQAAQVQARAARICHSAVRDRATHHASSEAPSHVDGGRANHNGATGATADHANGAAVLHVQSSEGRHHNCTLLGQAQGSVDAADGASKRATAPAVIVCGDFNDTLHSACLQALLQPDQARAGASGSEAAASGADLRLQHCWQDYAELQQTHSANGSANGTAVGRSVPDLVATRGRQRANGTAVASGSEERFRERWQAAPPCPVCREREVAAGVAAGVVTEGSLATATAAGLVAERSRLPQAAALPEQRHAQCCCGDQQLGQPGHTGYSTVDATGSDSCDENFERLPADGLPFTTWKFRRHKNSRRGIEQKKVAIDHVLYDAGRLEVVAMGAMPNEADLGAEALPCAEFPSDHLPVVLRVGLK